MPNDRLQRTRNNYRNSAYTFKGRDIAELNHSELLVALKWAMDSLRSEVESHRQTLEMMTLLNNKRRPAGWS